MLATALAAPPFESGPIEPVPAVPNAIAVADGELLLVGEQGVWIRAGDGWSKTDLPGATAIVIESDDAFLLCGPSGVTRYALDETRMSEVPCRDLAFAGDALWALGEQGVIDVSTGEPVDLGRPVEALGGGPERAWLSGNSLVVDGVDRLVFPGATGVHRIDREDVPSRWALVHPDRRLLGLLAATGLESAWPQPIAATAVTVGDLGNDGTLEIVLAGPDGWMPLTLPGVRKSEPLAVPAPRPIPIPAPEPPPVWKRPETASLLGVRMPRFGGLHPDPDYDQMFVGGFGVAVGEALGPNQLAVGFSPAATGGIERGGKRIRSYFGADSAPLFAWVGDTGGIHLAMATGGISFGSDRLRAGPFASIGLLGAGAGLRAVFTPFESRAGKLTGFEGRLTWFAPHAGHASLYYVSAFPLGRRYGPASERSIRPSACHRFGFGFGAAAGVSSTELAWEFVGRDVGYQVSGSPAISLSCDNGGKASGWHIGGETAPFFFYRVPTADGGADRRLHQMGTMTVGLYAGGNKLRVSPIATAGIWYLGGGLRAIVTPVVTAGGVHHGIELRGVALFPSSPAAQGMLLYHVWFDPRAGRDKPQPETGEDDS
ncbi:MAG: hypothetical protein R3F61_19955 [Myxococcota bacterium]